MKNLLLIMLIFFVGSQINATDISQKTKIFNKYLQDNFQIEIPDMKRVFFVVNAAGCETCKYVDFNYLNELSTHQNVTIIISYPSRLELPHNVVELTKKNNVLLDRGNYFRWNITPFTDGLIVTESKKIISLYEPEQWTSVSINNLLNKYVTK